MWLYLLTTKDRQSLRQNFFPMRNALDRSHWEGPIYTELTFLHVTSLWQVWDNIGSHPCVTHVHDTFALDVPKSHTILLRRTEDSDKQHKKLIKNYEKVSCSVNTSWSENSASQLPAYGIANGCMTPGANFVGGAFAKQFPGICDVRIV